MIRKIFKRMNVEGEDIEIILNFTGELILIEVISNNPINEKIANLIHSYFNLKNLENFKGRVKVKKSTYNTETPKFCTKWTTLNVWRNNEN